MRVALLFLPALAVVLLACGSKYDSFADPDVAVRDTNPDGVAYPATNLGGHGRLGKIPGNTIPNFAFQGYLESDTARTLVPISLAVYFDPKAARHKILLISVAASWCVACKAEEDTLAELAPALRAKGAVFLIALVEGPKPGSGPSLGDLNAWVDRHPATFTTVFDADARRLGTVEAAGVPWNALIDTRTMEILHSSVGAPDDVEKYLDIGIGFVDTHPL